MSADIDLFNAAVQHAQGVAYWRKKATEAGEHERSGHLRRPFELTRRQCLARVRYGQARIVDLAILSERRAAQSPQSQRETSQ